MKYEYVYPKIICCLAIRCNINEVEIEDIDNTTSSEEAHNISEIYYFKCKRGYYFNDKTWMKNFTCSQFGWRGYWLDSSGFSSNNTECIGKKNFYKDIDQFLKIWAHNIFNFKIKFNSKLCDQM